MTEAADFDEKATLATRNAVEGFAVESAEGPIFTVKGSVHPPERVIAYLRYVPDPEGDRERDGTRYRRVYRFEEQQRILRARYPDCLALDSVLGIVVQGPLRDRIRTVYDPRRRVDEIRRSSRADELESDAADLVELLETAAPDAHRSVGVTGSLLTRTHRPESDLDLVVYGERAARAVHGALAELLGQTDSPLQRLDDDELARLHGAHAADTSIPLADFSRAQERKVNEGHFRDRRYFIRFVRCPTETEESYGDASYGSLGRATIQARVTDDSEAIFTPCRYTVEDVRLAAAVAVEDLREIVSFRGRFSDQARTGELVVACGSVESVDPRSGSPWCRLIVGGPGDFLHQAPDA